MLYFFAATVSAQCKKRRTPKNSPPIFEVCTLHSNHPSLFLFHFCLESQMLNGVEKVEATQV